MEHNHDDSASSDARASSFSDGQSQPPTAFTAAPTAVLDSGNGFNASDAANDNAPALGSGVAVPFRPPPHLPHGSPTRRRSRVATMREVPPFSLSLTVWVSPESYRLGTLARGSGVSPHASSEPEDDESASGQLDEVVLTVEVDNESPTMSVAGDDPIGVVAWNDDSLSLMVESLECVDSDCLHRFDALEKDGRALCYICQDSLLEHPFTTDRASDSEHPSFAADHSSLNSARSGCPPPSVRAFPCRHLFHEVCLVPWLRMHTTCPTCRFDAAPLAIQNLRDPNPFLTATESNGTFDAFIRGVEEIDLRDASEPSASHPDDSFLDNDAVPERGRSRLAHPINPDSSSPLLPQSSIAATALPEVEPERPTLPLLPELQLDELDTRLLEGMAAFYESSSSEFDLFSPHIAHQEPIFLPSTQFEVTTEISPLDNDMPDLLSAPTTVFSLNSDPEAIAEVYGFRQMSFTMPSLEGSRQGRAHIAAVQPERAFAEWLTERESERRSA